MLSSGGQLHRGSFNQIRNRHFGDRHCPPDGHRPHLPAGQDHQQVDLRRNCLRQPGAGNTKKVGKVKALKVKVKAKAKSFTVKVRGIYSRTDGVRLFRVLS
jgi:hypothetical protein